MSWLSNLFNNSKKLTEVKDADVTDNFVHKTKFTNNFDQDYNENDELYDATFQSTDIFRKIKATEIKTNNIITRHFLLQSLIAESYRRRNEENYRDICIKYCEIHLQEFDLIAETFKNRDGEIPRVTVFQHYATLLTELEDFEKAIFVCNVAISYNLDDGTKGGFSGRIEKIETKIKQHLKSK